MKKLSILTFLLLFLAALAQGQHNNLTISVDHGIPAERFSSYNAISTGLHYDISSSVFISNYNSGIYELYKQYHREVYSEVFLGTHTDSPGLDVGFGTQYYYFPTEQSYDLYFTLRISKSFKL